MTIKFQGKHKSGYTVDVAQPFTFPAGEAHLKDIENIKVEDYDYFIVDVRGHSAQDLFYLALFAESIRDLAVQQQGRGYPYPPIYVLMPYLPAARADRGVPPGAAIYARFLLDVVDPDKIIFIDPHSPFIVDELGDYAQEYPFERLIKHYIQDATSDSRPMIYDGVIAPDKGARNRAERAARVMGVSVWTAGKTRDFETGKLTGFHMEDELPQSGRFLIVDDICDGGGTFIGLAEAIHETNPDVLLDLWVTHGIFSKGFNDLTSHFRHIHTTNSYCGPMSSDYIKVHDITAPLYNEINVIRG